MTRTLTILSIIFFAACAPKWMSIVPEDHIPVTVDTIYIDTSEWAKIVPLRSRCDSGYSYMMSISTSSLRIEADTCLPDSICKRLWKEFDENMCGETGFASFSLDRKGRGTTGYGNEQIWNDSTGCTTLYWIMEKGRKRYVSERDLKKYQISRGIKMSVSKTHVVYK